MSTLFCEVGYLARRELAVVLDHESPRGADWKGLADKMKFSYDVIVSLRGRPSPTLTLLEKWEQTAGVDANIDNLISLLETLSCMEGVDILKKEKERKVDHIDIPSTTKSRQSHGLPDPSPNAHYPLTPCSSIDPSAIDPEEIQRIRRVQVTAGIDPEQLAEGLAGISIAHSSPSRSPNSTNSTTSPLTTPSGSFSSKQTNHTSNKSKDLEKCLESIQKQQFDVFLSFAEADERFAEEVRQRLIENAGVRVFVPSAGLMSDRAFHEEIADMIKQGCTRTVVILSPDYLSSPWCGYEANLAFTNSPDARRNTTIPILYRPCEVPAFLSHLHYLDYPRFKDDRKNCEDYFWKRLYKSVTHHI